jgi:CBS domain-containing protein
MLTASDVMKKEVITIEKDAPITQAIEIMLEEKISGLPVVSNDMVLVGIITEKDILGLYGAPEEGTKTKVEDFMTTPAVYFEMFETFADICRCLIQNDFRRVPVVLEGKVVGIVSRPDVAEHILTMVREMASLTQA